MPGSNSDGFIHEFKHDKPLVRQVKNASDVSVAMIEAALLHLVKNGDVAKVNGRWVLATIEARP